MEIGRDMGGGGSEMWLGLDVGGTKIAGGLVGETGEVYKTLEVFVEENRFENLRAKVHEVVKGLVGPEVRGIGIGLPGRLDREGGVWIGATNLQVSGWGIASDLSQLAGLPVVIENDADSAALGEALYGGYKDLALVTWGTGVGLGIVLGGKIFRGPGGAAGELGHIMINPQGPMCRCGQRGCLELYAGGWGMAHLYEANGGEPTTTRKVFEKAEAGEALALSIRGEALSSLALAVGNLVRLMDLPVAVAGGIAMKNPDLVEALCENVRALITRDSQVWLAQGGAHVGVRGAAAVIQEALRG